MSRHQESPDRTIRIDRLPPPVSAADPDPVSLRIVYPCPRCAYPLRLRPEYFGRVLACRRCDVPFTPSLTSALTTTSSRAGSSSKR